MTDLRLIALACIIVLGFGLFLGLELDQRLRALWWWQ